MEQNVIVGLTIFMWCSFLNFAIMLIMAVYHCKNCNILNKYLFISGISLILFFCLLFINSNVHEKHLQNLLLQDKVLNYLVAQNVEADCTEPEICNQNWNSLMSQSIFARLKQTHNEGFNINPLTLSLAWMKDNPNFVFQKKLKSEINLTILNAEKQVQNH